MTNAELNAVMERPGRISTKALRDVVREAVSYEGQVACHRPDGRRGRIDLYRMPDMKVVMVCTIDGVLDLILEEE